MDQPDLVSDYDVVLLRPFIVGYIFSREQWRDYISIIRGWTSLAQVDEIISKANGLGPHRFEETWDSIERSETTFWRRQI